MRCTTTHPRPLRSPSDRHRPNGTRRAVDPAAHKPVGHSAAGGEATGERRSAATSIDLNPRCHSLSALRRCDPDLPIVDTKFDVQNSRGRQKQSPACDRRMAQPRIESHPIKRHCSPRRNPRFGARRLPLLRKPSSANRGLRFEIPPPAMTPSRAQISSTLATRFGALRICLDIGAEPGEKKRFRLGPYLIK